MHLFRMTSDERRDFLRLTRRWREDSFVCIMKSFTQHGCISTYQHCMGVAAIAFLLNRRWHLGADEESLICGAVLHDFFLYDWHGTDQGSVVKVQALTDQAQALKRFSRSSITLREIGVGPGNWTHSYKHPLIAAENARKLFRINAKERNIIETHMWPYTFWRTPTCREAWIVTLADKCCSTRETFLCRKAGDR